MMLNVFTERRCPLVPSDSAGGVLLLLAGVLGALFAPAAGADVTLSTRVEKVESILDGSGNVQRRLIPADGVQPGEELRYTITVSNDSALLVSEGRVVVTNPVPEGTVYLPGTAGGADCLIEFSSDGEIFSAQGVAAGSDTAEGSLSAEGSHPLRALCPPGLTSRRLLGRREACLLCVTSAGRCSGILSPAPVTICSSTCACKQEVKTEVGRSPDRPTLCFAGSLASPIADSVACLPCDRRRG